MDAIKAVQAKIKAVNQSLDGVLLLRFGNDEANQRNAVSEVYRIRVRAEHAGTSGTGAGADGGGRPVVDADDQPHRAAVSGRRIEPTLDQR